MAVLLQVNLRKPFDVPLVCGHNEYRLTASHVRAKLYCASSAAEAWPGAPDFRARAAAGLHACRFALALWLLCKTTWRKLRHTAIAAVQSWPCTDSAKQHERPRCDANSSHVNMRVQT